VGKGTLCFLAVILGIQYEDSNMTRYAIFLQHRTKPGQRDVVQKIWQKHMQPAISANNAHEVYVYCFATDPDRICAFQVYDSEASANAFLRSVQYLAYQREVEPLLEGAPQIEVLHPQWIKGTK
jgi:quinol monooxygenase YgiN